MRVIRIPEFGKIPINKGDRGLIESLRSFDRLHAQKSSGVPVFDWCNSDYVRALNYVGVIHVPGLTVEILPKIDKSQIFESESRADLAQNNLLYMLTLAKRIPFRERDLAPLRLHKMPLLEAMISIFSRRLLDELVIGMDHAYMRREENSCFVKGKILFDEQIKRNMHHKERAYVEYDNFVSDTWLNRILKTTCNRLLQISQSQFVKTMIYTSLSYFECVDDCDIEEHHFDQVQITRNNERYLPMLEFCRIFLKGGSPEAGYGAHSTFSLLFPMDRLFEEFVAAFIYKFADKINLQRSSIHIQAAGMRRWLLRKRLPGGNSEGKFRLRPDIIVDDRKGRPAVIVDTKWKHLLSDVEDDRNGVSQDDIYQLYAYSIRYNCDTNILLYPEVPGVTAKSYFVEGNEQKLIRIEFINLNRDIKNCQKELMEELGKIFAA